MREAQDRVASTVGRRVAGSVPLYPRSKRDGEFR
jgi:hypothetical protein